ncbi:MAG: hypothetical protein AAGF12_29905 [Myxococcota bacterium]
MQMVPKPKKRGGEQATVTNFTDENQAHFRSDGWFDFLVVDETATSTSRRATRRWRWPPGNQLAHRRGPDTDLGADRPRTPGAPNTDC